MKKLRACFESLAWSTVGMSNNVLQLSLIKMLENDWSPITKMGLQRHPLGVTSDRLGLASCYCKIPIEISLMLIFPSIKLLLLRLTKADALRFLSFYNGCSRDLLLM